MPISVGSGFASANPETLGAFAFGDNPAAAFDDRDAAEPADGGQSADPACERSLLGPGGSGASSPAAVIGLCGSGHSGKSGAEGVEARRRREEKPGAVVWRTGDIADLEALVEYFAFVSPCQ